MAEVVGATAAYHDVVQRGPALTDAKRGRGMAETWDTWRRDLLCAADSMNSALDRMKTNVRFCPMRVNLDGSVELSGVPAGHPDDIRQGTHAVPPSGDLYANVTYRNLLGFPNGDSRPHNWRGPSPEWTEVAHLSDWESEPGNSDTVAVTVLRDSHIVRRAPGGRLEPPAYPEASRLIAESLGPNARWISRERSEVLKSVEDVTAAVTTVLGAWSQDDVEQLEEWLGVAGRLVKETEHCMASWSAWPTDDRARALSRSMESVCGHVRRPEEFSRFPEHPSIPHRDLYPVLRFGSSRFLGCAIRSPQPDSPGGALRAEHARELLGHHLNEGCTSIMAARAVATTLEDVMETVDWTDQELLGEKLAAARPLLRRASEFLSRRAGDRQRHRYH